MRELVVPLVLLLVACSADGQGPAQSGDPWPTPPPNADGQAPAFPGQTRAPAIHSPFQLNVEIVSNELERPWAVALLPDGRFIVTERPGRMRIIMPDGIKREPLEGVPPVAGGGQGGLFDVTISPHFATDRMIYFSYAEPRGGDTNATAVARAVLSRDSRRLENVQVIFRQEPAWASRQHFGSRVVFDPSGTHVYITLGERNRPDSRPLAQQLDNDIGKIVRINPDGQAPADNPFFSRAGARREIWSYGHRNVQAAAINPATGELWTVEHGAQGGDEVNIPRAGRNYGWPIITYGEDYGGAPIGAGITQQQGMEQPIYYFDPVIAPSGAVFYRGDLFAGWRGDLLVGGLAGEALVRLKLNGERVVGEERMLTDHGRIRDIAEADNGAIYVVTDETNGELLRLTPRR